MKRWSIAVLWAVLALVVATGVAIFLTERHYHNQTADKGVLVMYALSATGGIATAIVALGIALFTALRDEEMRHDAVRPTLRMDVAWSEDASTLPSIAGLESKRRKEILGAIQTMTELFGPPGAVEMIVANDGAQTAVNVQALLARDITGFGKHPLLSLTSLEGGRNRYNLRAGERVRLSAADQGIAQGEQWTLLLAYEDVLGWRWAARARIEFSWISSHGDIATRRSEVVLVEASRPPEDIGLGPPVRLRREPRRWANEA
jgi:hypothetical protein